MTEINVKALGTQTPIYDQPDINILEKVKNPHSDTEYVIRFTCPEFTSICPITSQPDYAYFIIDYIADKFIVESKSLKLYLGSFRNHGAFHEDCSISIAKDIIKTISPKWFRIAGLWYPRGGIPIDIFYQTGKYSKDCFIPELELNQYKARF